MALIKTMKDEDVNEESEFWHAHKEQGRQKRWSNEEKSLQLLTAKGIKYEVLNYSSAHYRIGNWNFWPTTGKFYNPKTAESGRGVFALIKKLSIKKS